jgi:hypothetical protein
MLCATYLLVFVLIQAYQLIDQVLFNSVIGGIGMLKNFLLHVLPHTLCWELACKNIDSYSFLS